MLRRSALLRIPFWLRLDPPVKRYNACKTLENDVSARRGREAIANSRQLLPTQLSLSLSLCISETFSFFLSASFRTSASIFLSSFLASTFLITNFSLSFLYHSLHLSLYFIACVSLTLVSLLASRLFSHPSSLHFFPSLGLCSFFLPLHFHTHHKPDQHSSRRTGANPPRIDFRTVAVVLRASCGLFGCSEKSPRP